MPIPSSPDAVRRAAAVLVAALALLALAGPVLADVELASATPGPDDLVAGSPAELVIVFTGPIDPGRSSVLVVDAGGATVAEGGADETSSDGTTVTLPLPPLEPGVFEVRWTAVATDGHVSRDTYAFTVESSPSPSPSPVPSTEPSVAPSPSPSPEPSPSQPPDASGEPGEPASSVDPLSVALPILIVAVVVGIVAVWWTRRRAA